MGAQSNPWNQCDLHCIAYLKDAVEQGKTDIDRSPWCTEHFCHGGNCMSKCRDNMSRYTDIECSEVCKYAPPRSLSEQEQDKPVDICEMSQGPACCGGEGQMPIDTKEGCDALVAAGECAKGVSC